jgi:hypothetical protein
MRLCSFQRGCCCPTLQKRPVRAALIQTLIPGGAIGTIVRRQNTAGSLAGVAAPVLTGWIIEKTASFDAPIAAVGAWLLIGAASYVFLVRRKYAPLFGELGRSRLPR